MPTPAPRRRKAAAPKKLPTWVLVWIALTLVVLVFFLANKPTIDQVLETTGFAQAVGVSPEPAEILRPESVSLTDTLPPTGPALDDTGSDEMLTALTPPEPQETPPVKPEAEPVPAPPVPAQKVETRIFKPYFVLVNGDGQINLAPSRREVPLSASPLTAALKALLDGPSPEELSRGYLSLIPEGTRLLSTKVQNSTAYLSFSDEFQFNTLGMEGYTAQLKQVVYTATEFSTVKQVQILIEGKEREYLGSEAIPINRPLDRSSLDR